jgi:hypothetical protein
VSKRGDLHNITLPIGLEPILGDVFPALFVQIFPVLQNSTFHKIVQSPATVTNTEDEYLNKALFTAVLPDSETIDETS